MLGYIATTDNALPLAQENEGQGPTVDPITYAHPSGALAEAQALAGSGEGRVGPLALVLIVAADPEAWVAACGECLRVVGLPHDCTGGDGVVREFDAVLMHADRVRRS